MKVPRSLELCLVITSWGPNKGASRPVLLGKHITEQNTLRQLFGVFNTKYFCFYVSFIVDPSHHTEYREQNMTWVCHDLEQRFRLARPIKRHLRGLCSVLVSPHVSRPLGPSGQKGHASLPGACESDLSTCCPHHSHTGTHIPEGADTVSGDPIRPSLTR